MNNDERRRQAAQDADRILEELSNPSAPADEPQGEPAQEPQHQDQPANEEVERLKAERDQLKAQLEAESNTHKVSTLTGITKSQAEEIKALRKQIEELSKKPEPESPVVDESYNQDVADFGETTAKRMKADREKIQKLEAMVNELNGTLKPATERLEQVAKVSNQTAEDILKSALDAAAPEWRKLNSRDASGNLIDRGWDAFLDQTISDYSAQTYNDVLVDAYSRGDVATVAKIHNAYMQKTPAPKQQNLDKHIDPTPTGSSGGQQNTKPTYTREEYDRFMSDKRRGHTGLTSEEAKKKFDELTDALSDGRVIGY